MKANRTYPLITRFAFLAMGLIIITLPACMDKVDNPGPVLETVEANQTVLNYILFEDGAWWAFLDSTTLKQDTFILSAVTKGYQDGFPRGHSKWDSKPTHITFAYKANLHQTSTNRDFEIYYSASEYYSRKVDTITVANARGPMVRLIENNSLIKNSWVLLYFDFQLNDTLHFSTNRDTYFLLEEEGNGMEIFGKFYSEPYSKMKNTLSPANDGKDLELWLIEKTGFVRHTFGGNYYLVDHSAKNIGP